MTELEQLEEAINDIRLMQAYYSKKQKMRKSIDLVIKAARAHLEASKQEPVGWSLIFNKNIGINHCTSFKEKKDAQEYANGCAPDIPKIVPIYAAPPATSEVKSPEILAKDLEWLKYQKKEGHCDEGMLESQQRFTHNARIDRIIAASSELPATPDELHVAYAQGYLLDGAG